MIADAGNQPPKFPVEMIAGRLHVVQQRQTTRREVSATSRHLRSDGA